MTRIYLGDTVVVADQLSRGDAPVDLTDAEVTLSLAAPGGATIGGPATVDDPPTGMVTFKGDPADEAGTFTGRWIVEGDVVASYPAPSLTVVDPACEWATVAQVEAIAGAQNPDAVLAAIDAATALLRSAFCAPVDCPPPTEVMWATATIAARLVTRPAPGASQLVAESIGDYSYRYAADPQRFAADLIQEVRGSVWPYLCGWAQGPGVIRSPIAWPELDDFADTFGVWVIDP